MRLFHLAMLAVLLAPAAAHAEWQAANPAVTAAAKNPRIAAALEMTRKMDAAIIAHDVAAFGAVFTEDAVVNNPFNTIADKPQAIRNMQTGLIDYATLQRSIEYAATRGPHDVVLMGEESFTPVGKAKFAGTHARRRITEIWTDAGGSWKLAIRQATIFEAK